MFILLCLDVGHTQIILFRLIEDIPKALDRPFSSYLKHGNMIGHRVPNQSYREDDLEITLSCGYPVYFSASKSVWKVATLRILYGSFFSYSE